LNRWVFKRLIKTVSDGADMTICGRECSSLVTATGKARSPMVKGRVR